MAALYPGRAAGPARFGALVALWGCPPPAVPEDPPRADPPAVVEPTEPDDSPVPAEPDGESDLPPPDTDVVVAAGPPTSWGEGFVDLTAAHDPVPMFPGDPILSAPPQESTGAIADLDGDGVLEVLLGSTAWGIGRTAELRAFHYDPAAGLVRDPSLEEALGVTRGPPFAALDLDGDGAVDLIMPGSRSVVRWGDGSGRFPEETPLDLGRDRSFFTGLALSDVDRDGWLDLIAASTTCGGGVIPLLREGPRRFVARADLMIDQGGPAFIDAVGVLPSPDGADRWLAIATSCDLSRPHLGFYVSSAADATRTQFMVADLSPPDAFWRLLPTSNGGPFTTVAPMGAAFTDLDLDGIFDVVLSLGLPQVALLYGRADGGFVDRSVGSGVLADPAPGLGLATEFAWSVLAPDLDLDGRPDLLLTMGDDSTSHLLARGHVMQSQAWWSAGDGTFVDVSDAVGLTPRGGWHGLVPEDLDQDGDMDLLMAGFGVSPRVLHNRVAIPDRRALALELVGTTSNLLGVGAIVDVEVAGLPPRRLLMGDTANFGGLGRPRAFVGLGESAEAARVRISWPSGLQQELTGVAGGRLHRIVEPTLLHLPDADRRAPADGASQVFVEVTPRAPDGSPRAGVVDAALLGPGQIVAVEPVGSMTRVVVLAPAAPGSTQVEVRIDGVVVPIRPRLWWD